MINSTPPVVKPEPETTEAPAETNESIIFHTEIPETPEKGVKKYLALFKRKPSTPIDGTEPTPEAKPANNGDRPSRAETRRAKTKVKDPGPDMRLRAFMEPSMSNPPAKEPKKFSLKPTRERTHRAYWDVAGTLSLIVNVILVAVLVLMAGQIKNMKSMLNNLLGGLYGNFVEMDKATISTTIPVEAQIPLSFSLPISQM